jgi:hypothetical protein
MRNTNIFGIRVSIIGTRTLALAAAAIVALALPASVAARGGHGGGGHGGGGHGGGGHGGAHIGGAHVAHIGGAHIGGSHIGGAHFAHSFSHGISHGRTIGGLRYGHVSRAGRLSAGSHLTRASFAARANAHINNAPARFAHSNFAARGARWNGRADWWRYRHGFFFGWAGPLFWPYFDGDLWSDVFWDGGPDYYYDPFWAYGYGDIYGALFSPYGYGGLAGWAPAPPLRTGSIAPNAPSGPASPPTQWSAMCGGDTQVVDLPIDKISAAVAPNDQQRAALDALANASVQAAQLIKSACPSDVAYTPTGRMAAMEHRVQAMVQAVALIRDPLDKFYDSLTDEQKARLNGLNLGDANAPRATASTCGPNAAPIPTWPQAQIEKAVQPTDAQQPLLAKLKDASAKATDMLKAACPTTAPATPPARLDAVAKRLDALLDAVKLVHAALNDFYGSLSDEQKAQFNGIAPMVQNGGARR